VVSTASAVGAKAIIALSESGLTARMVSRFRPAQPVIAMSPKDYVVRQLELVFGCFPARIEHFTNVSDVMKVVRAYVLKNKLQRKGQGGCGSRDSLWSRWRNQYHNGRGYII